MLPHSSRGGRRKAAPYRSDILDLVSGHTYRRQRKELTRPFPMNSAWSDSYIYSYICIPVCQARSLCYSHTGHSSVPLIGHNSSLFHDIHGGPTPTPLGHPSQLMTTHLSSLTSSLPKGILPKSARLDGIPLWLPKESFPSQHLLQCKIIHMCDYSINIYFCH